LQNAAADVTAANPSSPSALAAGAWVLDDTIAARLRSQSRPLVTRPSRWRAIQWCRDRSIFGKVLLVAVAAGFVLGGLAVAVDRGFFREFAAELAARTAADRMALAWHRGRAARQAFVIHVSERRLALTPLRKEAHATIDRAIDDLNVDYAVVLQSPHADEILAAIGGERKFRTLLHEYELQLHQVIEVLDSPISPQETWTLDRVRTLGDRIDAAIQSIRDRLESHLAAAKWHLAVASTIAVLIGSTGWLGILYVLARHISVRLRPIDAAAERVGRGELDTRIEIYGADEIGRLGERFNAMASRLEDEGTFLRRIIRSLGDAVVVLYPPEPGAHGDAVIRMVNQAALDLLGYEEEEIIGEPISKIVPQRPTVHVHATTKDETLLTGEVVVVGKGHRSFPASFALSVLHARDGGVQAILLSAQDVTERKLAEQRKSDFVSFTSHQLRTPLTALKWLLELASAEDADAIDVRSYISDARQSVERLIQLVNDLLQVSRLESGRLKVTLEAVDLGELTRSVFSEFEPQVNEKSIAVGISIAAVPPVNADRGLLRQVVQNLLSNAFKFTPAGGRVDIAVEREDDKVHWQVRDTGIGIPDVDRGRLFGKFERAENAVVMETEGTGLGLYIVRLLVDRFRGRVWCESQIGKGSVFTFELPLSSERKGP
jgi:PAS domain S-box-containing protein